MSIDVWGEASSGSVGGHAFATGAWLGRSGNRSCQSVLSVRVPGVCRECSVSDRLVDGVSEALEIDAVGDGVCDLRLVHDPGAGESSESIGFTGDDGRDVEDAAGASSSGASPCATVGAVHEPVGEVGPFEVVAIEEYQCQVSQCVELILGGGGAGDSCLELRSQREENDGERVWVRATDADEGSKGLIGFVAVDEVVADVGDDRVEVASVEGGEGVAALAASGKSSVGGVEVSVWVHGVLLPAVVVLEGASESAVPVLVPEFVPRSNRDDSPSFTDSAAVAR